MFGGGAEGGGLSCHRPGMACLEEVLVEIGGGLFFPKQLTDGFGVCRRVVGQHLRLLDDQRLPNGLRCAMDAAGGGIDGGGQAFVVQRVEGLRECIIMCAVGFLYFQVVFHLPEHLSWCHHHSGERICHFSLPPYFGVCDIACRGLHHELGGAACGPVGVGADAGDGVAIAVVDGDFHRMVDNGDDLPDGELARVAHGESRPEGTTAEVAEVDGWCGGIRWAHHDGLSCLGDIYRHRPMEGATV